MMPKSSAMYLPWLAASTPTKMLPGCMSAWKKPSRNTCVKKISTPARASRLKSMPAARSVGDAADRDAGHPLHDEHFARRPVPVDLGHPQQRRAQEIAPQLRAVGRLAHQVELVVDRLVEFGDDVARPQALAFAPQPLDERRRRAHQREIVLDHLADVRAAAPSRRPACRREARRNAPARPTRSPPASGRTC